MLLAEVYVELTGGRQVSFNMNKNYNKTKVNIESIKIERDNKKTIVIKPTQDELTKHKSFLNKIPSNSWNY